MTVATYNAFMKANLTNYVGEWIVVVDDEIVSHGKDIKTIYSIAKEKYPDKTPLITKVPDKATCIF